MKKKYYLVLDVGTSGIKALLFTHQLTVVARLHKEIKRFVPKPNFVEQDPQELVQTSIQVLKDVVKHNKVNIQDIAAIGITNQRETTILWDKKTGEPVYKAIVWEDNRTQKEARSLKQYAVTVKEKTGLQILPYFSALKIAWILKNVQKAKKLLKKKQLLFGTVDSWILWNITKEKIHATDMTNASRTLLFNIRSCAWDKQLMKMFSVEEVLLPNVFPSQYKFGTLKKDILGKEIPIMAVCGDQQASLYGVGVTKGTTKITYGTGTFIMQSIGKKFNVYKDFFTTLIPYKKGVGYAVEAKIDNSGAQVTKYLTNKKKLLKILDAIATDATRAIKNLPIIPKKIIGFDLDGEYKTVTVQPGMSLHQLQQELSAKDLYFPPVPTFDGATVGGVIATNAAGAATFKYGQTRPWVEAITVVLANGEVLDIKRDQYISKAPKRRNQPSYFELVHPDGTKPTIIPVPNYSMPDVAKISAGYYGKHRQVDLIDLFIGSEGTLGVITQATLKVIPKPVTSWAMIPCESESQALEITRQLRTSSQRTWQTKDQNGIDIAAIEYIDQPSLELLREDGKNPPKNANALLLVQLEMTKEQTATAFDDLFDENPPDVPIVRFGNILNEFGLFENPDFEIATPDKIERIDRMKMLREAVPGGVNGRNRQSGFQKVAADMIVPFDRLSDMLTLFEQRFSEAGLQYAIWGHFSDGNVHPNVISRSEEDVKRGKQIIVDCGKEVIAMGGSPLAEHGVGKHEGKQELLKLMYGEEGIAQMRMLKKAFDPNYKLAPGNLFTSLPTEA